MIYLAFMYNVLIKKNKEFYQNLLKTNNNPYDIYLYIFIKYYL
jgi:hypothetical protein